MSSSHPDDTDFARVLEVLAGARRGPADPDAELATLLHDLGDADNSAVLDALQRLLRDANLD